LRYRGGLRRRYFIGLRRIGRRNGERLRDRDRLRVRRRERERDLLARRRLGGEADGLVLEFDRDRRRLDNERDLRRLDVEFFLLYEPDLFLETDPDLFLDTDLDLFLETDLLFEDFLEPDFLEISPEIDPASEKERFRLGLEAERDRDIECRLFTDTDRSFRGTRLSLSFLSKFPLTIFESYFSTGSSVLEDSSSLLSA